LKGRPQLQPGKEKSELGKVSMGVSRPVPTQAIFTGQRVRGMGAQVADIS